ncbi:MAG: glycosyltransferase, partial [Paracoccus sp. (in: a-proteobacteria)]|nr:glycosyltransferase [Paracoccus sp. (in: a-proteobacteria)]
MDGALVDMTGLAPDMTTTDLRHLPPVPPESPLHMPVQDFRARPVRSAPGRWRESWRTWAARLLTFGGTAAITWIGFAVMLDAFGDQPLALQIALLALFTPTFAWVGMSFCSMLAGLFAARPRDPADVPGRARLAVVMPVYHENAAVSISLLVALARDLDRLGFGDRAEIFVLSDSRDPEVAVNETLAVSAARELSPLPVWYRRRDDNTDRKSGNLAEFWRRWAGRYDQIVVLDADSVMTGDTVARLSARMEADPQIGLIQTMPMLVGGETIFARVVQFAGRVYGPMIARGVAAWSGQTGNYWGH